MRQPAAFCGVLGMKPTYGRVSRYGLIAFASSLDQVGPFTHYAEDKALLMNVIAGHDARDSTSLKVDAEDYQVGLAQSLSGLKVGVLTSQLESSGWMIRCERQCKPQLKRCVRWCDTGRCGVAAFEVLRGHLLPGGA